jgi:hypothetical protein
MSYRFKINMRQYRAGDPVPEGFEPGVVSTMLERGFIEPASGEKKLETVPENKSMVERPVATKLIPATKRSEGKHQRRTIP